MFQRLIVLVSLGLLSVSNVPPRSCLGQQIDFNLHIKPILSDRCFICHGPDSEQRAAELRLDTQDGLMSVLVPGNIAESELLRRLTTPDQDDLMPPKHSNLSVSSDEIALIRQWIEEGAAWQQHWSFAPLAAPSMPKLVDPALCQNEIDRFVLAKLEQRKLSFAPLASREKFLRRVTFDLTGLPPTLDELDNFLADQTSSALETVIDRLLNSPRFGERMATDWLDIARYSDTFGFQVDGDRYVWPYRDWVIRAFNDNMPFDRFAVEQLAGDLLPNPTEDQILATTFNRLHAQKVEGGSIEEEFRVEYVSDRVQTFGTAFLGLTIECARCHDHKFDPVSQVEYFQLFAFFNNIDEAGLHSYFDSSATPTPALTLLSDVAEEQLSLLKSELVIAEKNRADIYQAYLDQSEAGRFQIWLDDFKTRADLASKPMPGLIDEIDFSKIAPGDNQRIESGEQPSTIQLTGDDEIPVGMGKFAREQPFTIATHIKIPGSSDAPVIDRNVIFHCSRAWTDSASRGYQLLIEDGKLSASLIHFWPGNAISIRTTHVVPVNQWQHVVLSYDGSSTASGMKLFVNGQVQPVDVVKDNLTRTILGSGTDQLIIGARFRDRGFKNGQVNEFVVFDRQLSEIEIMQLHDGQSLNHWLTTPVEKMDAIAREALRQYFVLNHCPELTKAEQQVKQRRMALNEFFEAQPEIMVMQELPSIRPTHVLLRGAYDAPAALVSANVPAVLPPLPTGIINAPNRLDLAQWLVNRQNPLTSRVAVNHYWQIFFGNGLVRTPEDFGSQSQPPTHPELLDWFALDFQTDWNIKRCLKQIVMSRTYQQSSLASSDLLGQDPDNELLARASSFRLTAEMLRDNVLYQSGLMVEKIGGSPVKPYDLAVAFAPSIPDQGDGLYRRSLYTYWKRTGAAPSMIVLDAAKRDNCQVKREQTSSPLQALVLLNGPQFTEAARKLSEKLIRQHGDNSETLATEMFRLLTSRYPHSTELKVILNLYRQQLERFEKLPDDVTALLAIGESKSDIPQTSELAAWTTVTTTLMNFDECVVRR